MAKSKLDILNQAIVLLGDTAVTSFEQDDGAAAQAARQIYDRLVESLFTVDSYKFRFAVKQFKLNQLQAAPMDADDGGFKYAYALPSDFLQLVVLNTRFEYEIYGNQIRCNDTNLILDYVYRVDESLWPAYFEEMVVYRLAADLCMPVTDNASLEDRLMNKFDMARRTAKAIDSKQVPNKPFSQSPMLIAHAGGFGSLSRRRR